MNFHRRKLPLSRLCKACVILAGSFALCTSARSYTLLTSNQLVFVNVDHAPIGTYSTFSYGTKGSRCGLGLDSSSIPYSGGGGGVIIALSGSGGIQALPFVDSAASVSSSATFFPDASVQRTLTPCADQWNVNNGGLTLTHYTPAWTMPSLTNATVTAQQRFFLPATWMVFTVNNTNTTPEDFYFGLPTSATPATFATGAYQGFTLGEAVFATQTGSCDALSGSALSAALNGMATGFAFHINVPAGQTKSLTVVLAFYRSAVTDTRIGAHYYYTTLFGSMGSVIDAAFAGLADAQTRCQQLASAMAGANLNVYRQFLASDALHSHMACTVAELDSTNGFCWREMEGEYNYINTFDLTVDHSFYDSVMYPWALRNVLDTYSGVFNGAGYNFVHPLYDVTSSNIVSSAGFGFHHDMGTGITSDSPATDPTGYESGFSYMGQEELDNWIVSSGLYWSRTGDSTWLTNNTTLLQDCLASMLLRDDTNAATRDGVTSYLNERGTTPEITTYDGLDSSLKDPRLNAYTTVKNWAAYLALNAMFQQLGDAPDAATASNSAALAAQSIVNAWNTYQTSPGYIPAFLDGSNLSALLPIVEGLAYPAQMGLTNAVDPVNGPYAAMMQALSNHVNAVLVSGRCLDSTSGGWKLSSANNNTWESKVYLGQYIVENILGITNSKVDGNIDQIHATIEFQEANYQGWSDQLNSTGSGNPFGSRHYPRGVTSALWWLNTTNNPAYPVPVSAPNPPDGLAAIPNNGEVILLWNGSALTTGYVVERSSQMTGPFLPVGSPVTGASFLDSGLTDGDTYYYTVVATNQVGNSVTSAVVSATPYLPPPSGLTATAGNAAVVLNWSSSVNAVGYDVFRATSSNAVYAGIASNITATTFTDSAVTNGFTYYYVITALNSGGGASAISTQVSATPSISIPLYAVNCGGPAVGTFSADAYYADGSTYSTAMTVNTNNAAFPAPMQVYQTERYAATPPNVTYVFTNLAPGSNYLVRLHFAEIYFSSAGQRVFNVLINGNQVLTNFDIFAAAGSSNTAVALQFTLPASTAGQFVIVATNVVQNAKISGVQILSVGALVPTTGTNITTGFDGTNLNLSWPSNYVGWILQTNGLDINNGVDWSDIPGSATNQLMSFPVRNSAAPQEFFRLRYPY